MGNPNRSAGYSRAAPECAAGDSYVHALADDNVQSENLDQQSVLGHEDADT